MEESWDAIIAGGGVIGLTTARRLAREGLSVCVIERSVCGGESSWAGAGILTPCNPHRTDLVAALQDRTLSLYPGFCGELLAETGIDPEYEPSGELDLLFTTDSLRIAKSDERAAAGRRTPQGQLVFQLHSAPDVRRIEPLVSQEVLGALECRATAHVRNPRLLQALNASCLRAGVILREQTEVTDFIIDGSRITGVEIAARSVGGPHRIDGRTGERLHSRFVILCAGAWSSGIGRHLMSLMPVHPVRGQVVLLKAEKRPFVHVVSRGKTYLVPRRDGHVILGSTEEPEAGFSKRNTAQAISKLLETAVRMVPALESVPVAATWAGLRPATPDEKPYIGPVPGLDGLIAATGHFRAGLTLAPATADAVAAMIFNRPYDIDLSCCRPGRT